MTLRTTNWADYNVMAKPLGKMTAQERAFYESESRGEAERIWQRMQSRPQFALGVAMLLSEMAKGELARNAPVQPEDNETYEADYE